MVERRSAALQRQETNACLVVEDSEFDRQRLTRIVRNTCRHMPIEEAATLRRARAALQKGGIGLILLDNNMPDGWGAEFAVELKSDPQMAHIPVIIVSDWPSPFMWQKAQSAGVSYVLSKSEFKGAHILSVLQGETSRRVG